MAQRKAPLILGVAVGAMVGAPLIASAAGGSGSGSSTPGRQAMQWHLTADHTSSRHWVYVDARSILTPSSPFAIHGTGLVTVTLSGSVSGGPVQIRALDADKTMGPGPARFATTTTPSSVSFTYSHSLAKEATCGRSIRLQWRSPAGARIDLSNADLVVTWLPTSTSTPPKVCY